jgi:sugar phosphate isomerase/epimerase
MDLLQASMRTIAQAADEKGLRLVFELLNRYETYLVNNSAEAFSFLDSLRLDNLGLYLNAFHMNIEEQDAAATLRQAGDRLWLYAMSDSNRQAIGRGHIKLGAHLWALEDIKYAGPIIIECLPSGANPFAPSADEEAMELLAAILRDSRSWF